jgi:hypothetical protein
MHRIVRYGPLLLPAIACLMIFAMMRPDCLRTRDSVPMGLKWLLYDESDLTALVLRGANAYLGRIPGRRDEPEEPDWTIPPKTLPLLLDGPQPPFQPRYYLEYPTPTLPLFWLGFALQSDAGNLKLPSVVADAQQFSVAYFEPRTDSERELWTRFRIACQIYIGMMTIGLILLIVVLARGYEPGSTWGGPIWLAVLPGALFFTLNRFDILPTLMTAVAFACLGRGRLWPAGVFLGIGVLWKLYPILFAPVIMRFLGFRSGFRFVLGLLLTISAGFGVSMAWLGVEPTLAPIQVQLARGLLPNHWALYGRLLPESLGHAREFRLALLMLTILAMIVTRPPNLESVLRRCGVILVGFVVMAVFWSPQWIIWFLPIFIPLGRRRWWPIVAAATLDVTNYLSFPVLFWNLLALPLPDLLLAIEVMTYIRGLVWFAVAAAFLVDEWRTCSAALFSQPIAASIELAMRTYHAEYPALRSQFLERARQRGMPRGLIWQAIEEDGKPWFGVDAARGIVALVPMIAEFAPIPGSDMEEIPQAREPRQITIIYVWNNGRWECDGRAIFNLKPDELIERFPQRYRECSRT